MKVIIRLEIPQEYYNAYEYFMDEFCENIADISGDVQVEEIEL